MSKPSSNQTSCSQIHGLLSELTDGGFISQCLFLPTILGWCYLTRGQSRNVIGSYLRYRRLSDRYAFQKPNDRRALDLMNAAAVEVLKDLPDLAIAYGVSDEYRFVSDSSVLVSWVLC